MALMIAGGILLVIALAALGFYLQYEYVHWIMAH